MLHDSIQCCNFMELVGFNGDSNRVDYDIFDDGVWNLKAGILAVAYMMNAWGDQPEGVGSVFMTVAWDKYEDNAPEMEHIDPWARGHGRDGTKFCRRMRRFIKYIHNNGLGKVHSVPDTTNPNHNSRVRTRIWHVDQKAVRLWAKDYDRPEQSDRCRWEEGGF